MLNYRNLEIGQHILFTGKEPPDFKPFEEECVVIEKHTDHAIAQYEDVKVWIDDDTANLFYTLEKNQDGKIAHKNVLQGGGIDTPGDMKIWSMGAEIWQDMNTQGIRNT